MGNNLLENIQSSRASMYCWNYLHYGSKQYGVFKLKLEPKWQKKALSDKQRRPLPLTDVLNSQ